MQNAVMSVNIVVTHTTRRLTINSSGLKRVQLEVKNMAALYIDTEVILSSRFGVPRAVASDYK